MIYDSSQQNFAQRCSDIFTGQGRDYGYTNTSSTINPEDPLLAKTWMSRLNPQIPLSLVNIPGTHNAASYKSPCWSKFSTRTQSISMLDQLKAGIRYFDMRIKYNSSGELIIFHGPVDMKITFAEVVEEVKQFMTYSSKQSITMIFQGMEQRNKQKQIMDPSEDILKTLKKYIGEDKILISKQIPTVGQSRGKIWVIGGFWIPFANRTTMLQGYPNFNGFAESPSKYYLQSLGDINSTYTVANKVNDVHVTAFDIHPSKYHMKYNSLCCAGDITRFISQRPIVIAKDKQGPNAYMHEILKRPERMNARLGVMFMDFPGCRLLDQIINSNRSIML